MALSQYHQKYLNRTKEDIAERIVAKEAEFKQIFEANYKVLFIQKKKSLNS